MLDRRALVLLLAVGLFPSLPAFSQGRYGGIPFPTTRQMMARVEDKKMLLWETITRFVYEERSRTVKVKVEDKEEERTETYTVSKPVWEIKMHEVELAKVKAFGTGRQPIKQRRLANQLAEGRPVLVADPNTKIDPRYLELVSDDAIFILLPPPEGPAVLAAPPPPGTNPPAGPEPPPLPRGMPPLAVQASLNGDDTVEVKRRFVFNTIKTGYLTRGEGDKSQLVPATIKQIDRQETVQEFKVDSVRTFTAAGEEISADELRQRLGKETTVLVSGDGRPVDPGYLRIIREDALVLVVPFSPN
ncbi:MAG: hypothetical protein AB7O62_22810 [Pirellulales bacterium]